jgi:hypothetical protein
MKKPKSAFKGVEANSIFVDRASKSEDNRRVASDELQPFTWTQSNADDHSNDNR